MNVYNYCYYPTKYIDVRMAMELKVYADRLSEYSWGRCGKVMRKLTGNCLRKSGGGFCIYGNGARVIAITFGNENIYPSSNVLVTKFVITG